MHRITLRHQRRFVADHFHDLPGFQEDRHGHNWELEAEVVAMLGVEAIAPSLDEILDAWISDIDYTLLNAQSNLEGRNPTAEVLAEWAFRHLERAGLNPVEVKIREKANYWAACRRAQA